MSLMATLSASHTSGGPSIGKVTLEDSAKKLKDSFKKEMEDLKSKNSRPPSITSSTDEKHKGSVRPFVSNVAGHSPFFSPLKASDLGQRSELPAEVFKSIDTTTYKRFIKPSATPLNDLLGSQSGAPKSGSTSRSSPFIDTKVKTPGESEQDQYTKRMSNTDDFREASTNLNRKFEHDNSTGRKSASAFKSPAISQDCNFEVIFNE